MLGMSKAGGTRPVDVLGLAKVEDNRPGYCDARHV